MSRIPAVKDRFITRRLLSLCLFGSLASAFLIAQTNPFLYRIRPTADVVMYVAPQADCLNGYWVDTQATTTTCGSDTTGDGTQSLPYSSVQKAHDVLASDYDLQGKYKATIQVAVANTGTWFYGGVKMSGRLVGQGGSVPPLTYLDVVPEPDVLKEMTIGKYLPYTLRGDPANITGAMIRPGQNGFTAQPGITISDQVGLKVEGLTLGTNGIDHDVIDAFNSSFLELSNVRFGNAGSVDTNGLNRFLHIGLAMHSTMRATGPIYVTGGAAAFIQADDSYVSASADGGSSPIPIIFENSPRFIYAIFWIDGAKVYANKFSFSGAVHSLTRKVRMLNAARVLTGGTVANPNVNLIPGLFNAAQDVEAGSILS